MQVPIFRRVFTERQENNYMISRYKVLYIQYCLQSGTSVACFGGIKVARSVWKIDMRC